MFQSLAYLNSDVIDNSEKKIIYIYIYKSDLKLNRTQGQLKCFFKLSSCCMYRVVLKSRVIRSLFHQRN